MAGRHRGRKLAVRFGASLLPLLAGLAWGQASQLAETTLDGTVFRLPPGIRIEKVAAAPLVQRPIVAAWDDRGRLLVLEAAGPVDRPAETAGSRPHRLVRLVDQDGDGQFDQRIVAAEDLSFPVGVLARGNQVLVSAPPEIWSLTDRDGDGICEERSVWFNPGTATHCYNDLHGPYLGRDGWIYWTKGAFAAQSFTTRDQAPFASTAAHIYRRRLEGGPIEAVLTGGMDNPVEVVFSPEGERFFTSTFLQFPAGGRRDGIAHAVYGGLYGKKHDVLQGHWRTGELMPIMTHLGPAAPSGLAWMEQTGLLTDAGIGGDVDRSQAAWLVAAQFNLQKVSVHRLVPQGASFRTEDVDLLLTDRIEFHPTDVLEDVDGSWLVLDTGGWYDLCCPSSAVDQSAALGGIYRLTSPRLQAARGKRQPTEEPPHDWETAWAAVNQAGAWQRQRAEDWLVENPSGAVAGLLQVLRSAENSVESRLRSLWLLCRLGSPEARVAIVDMLKSEESRLRQAAALAISVHRWPEEQALSAALALEKSSPVQRALAEALGRVGTEAAVPGLMDCIAKPETHGDRFLEHSLIYALIELNQSPAIATYQNSSQPAQWQAATRVLHERGEELNRERLLAMIGDRVFGVFAAEILAEHPEFLDGAEAALNDWYQQAAQGSQTDDTVSRAVAFWSQTAIFHELLARELARPAVLQSPQNRQFVWDLAKQCRFEALPASWNAGLTRWLRSELLAEDEKRAVLEWLQQLPRGGQLEGPLQVTLRQLAEEESSVALLAAACLSPDSELSAGTIEHILTIIETNQPEDGQPLAWQALGQLKLSESATQRLVDTAPTWGVGVFGTAVEILATKGSDDANLRLLERLESHPLTRTIPVERYQDWYRNRSERLRDKVEQITEQLTREIAREAEQRWAAVDELLEKLPDGGDPNRGMQVFRSTQAACSSCHQVAYVGGRAGPDLSRIGATRSRREILEAIAYPSARQEQSYRAERFALLDGRVLSGLIEAADADTLTIRVGVDQRVRIRRDEIEDRVPSEVSLMPAGMVAALSPQELADLIAFLESRR